MTVIVKTILNVPIHNVWEAITNPSQMIQWYFENMPDFKPEVGFTTSFKMLSHEGRNFTAIWKVIEVVPENKIVCNWSYQEYSGLGVVTFLLSTENDKTLITVINEGLESFPQEIPEFTKESCMAGWEYFIKKRLPEFLYN